MTDQQATTVPVPFSDETWQLRWRELLLASRELVHVGRWSDVDLVLRSGERGVTLHLVGGRPSADPAENAERIVLDGAPQRWRAFLQPLPPPFHNTVLAMDRRCPDFAIAEGHQALVRHLRTVTVVLDVARSAAASVPSRD